mgnify:CR=1 FL=1
MNKSLVFILLALGLLATTASAFNSPPVLKKSLYLRDSGRTAYNIFRTKNATISFSTDHTNYHQVDPTYRVLGFNPSSVNQILRNISQECDQKSYIYSQLAYYEKNDSLLYFCYNNKSLLVLDSNSYAVKKSIPLTFDFPYLEMAKLYPEGDSLVLLLINSGFRQGFTDGFNSTVFIRVNLISQQVTQNFVLDKGFSSTESVVAYAGNGTTSYILTNSYKYPLKNITVYAFNTSGNNYSIASLYAETFNFSKPNSGDLFNQLFVAGDLVITNNNGTILFFNNKGQLISKASGLVFYYVDFNGWRANPAFFEGRNKNFYYQSDKDLIIQFTVQGTSIKSKILVNGGTHLQIARGNSQKGDQIFYLQLKPTYDDSYWFVLDLDTSKIISQVPVKYDNIFTTDSTYGILTNKTISIFGWNNETFLTKVRIEQSTSNDEFYYYDSENSYFYFLRYPVTPASCNLIQVDIRTASSRPVSSLKDASFCAGRITQVNSSSLDFVIENKFGGYYINSARYGQVDFSYTFEVLQRGFAAFDFDDLSTHLIHYSLPTLSWNHSFYTFDSRSRAFTKQNSSRVMGLENIRLRVFRYFGGQKVFISNTWAFNSLDLTTNVVTAYEVHYRDSVPTKLFGNNGDEGFIVTDKQVYSGIPYYYKENTGEFGSLPTEQELALDARASGRCKYFQSNAYFQSETTINIYDFCGSSDSEKVPFIRKFLRRYSV